MRKGDIISKEVFKLVKKAVKENPNVSISFLTRHYSCYRKTIRKYIKLINEGKELTFINQESKKMLSIKGFKEIIDSKLAKCSLKIYVYNFLTPGHIFLGQQGPKYEKSKMIKPQWMIIFL